jgi:hypothetical protein
MTKRMPADRDDDKQPTHGNPDEVALELMKFIAVTTGYGKGPSATGFASKTPRSSEEYADALLELFDRCRTTVRKVPQ